MRVIGTPTHICAGAGGSVTFQFRGSSRCSVPSRTPTPLPVGSSPAKPRPHRTTGIIEIIRMLPVTLPWSKRGLLRLLLRCTAFPQSTPFGSWQATFTNYARRFRTPGCDLQRPFSKAGGTLVEDLLGTRSQLLDTAGQNIERTTSESAFARLAASYSCRCVREAPADAPAPRALDIAAG
jgi:hypothetical protein